MSSTETVEAADQLIHLPLEELTLCPTNPRKHRDEKSLKDLAASIQEKGVLEPIIARPITGAPSAPHFEIVCGERRFLASQIAEKSEIPAIVRELDNRQVLEIQVIESLQRAEIHELDEAEGYRRLIEMNSPEANYPPEVVAEKVGKSKAYVYGRLQLLKLDPKAMELFYKGEMNVAVASRIARLQPKDQLELLKYFRRDGGIFHATVRDVDDWINRQVFLNLDSTAFMKDDVQLYPEAGPCTSCPKRTGASPLLFPEFQRKQKNLCTDPVCFHEKVNRFVQIQVEANPDAVKIAAGYVDWNRRDDLRKEGILLEDDYRDSKEGTCPFTVRGIVVAGDGRSYNGSAGAAPGQTKYICIGGRKCRVHFQTYALSPVERERQRRQAAEARKKAAIRERIFDALVAKVKGRKDDELSLDDLRVICAGFFADIWHEHQKVFATLNGYVKKKPNGSAVPGEDMHGFLKKLVARASLSDLYLYLELALVKQRSQAPYSYEGGQKDELLAAASRWKVNTRSIVAEVERQFREAEAKRKEAEKRRKQREKAKAKAASSEAKQQRPSVDGSADGQARSQ